MRVHHRFVVAVLVFAAALVACSEKADEHGATDADAGVDAAPQSSGLTCPPYDGLKACTADTDCAVVMAGCWCGAQPVVGIAQANEADATQCQEEKKATCNLACPILPDQQAAEDGKTTADGGAIAVGCVKSKCKTTVN